MMGRIRWKQEEAEEEEELAAGNTEIYQFKMEAQRKRASASSFAGVLMGVISAVRKQPCNVASGTDRPTTDKAETTDERPSNFKVARIGSRDRSTAR